MDPLPYGWIRKRVAGACDGRPTLNRRIKGTTQLAVTTMQNLLRPRVTGILCRLIRASSPSAHENDRAGDATAIRNIVNTALHEAAHSLGFDHTEPLWMGSYDLYAEAPFNLLSPGTNSCITGW